MTLHSHYTAEHKINRCASSSWRFTDDILYPFGSNIFFFSLFIFIRIKKEETLLEPGQYYFQSFNAYLYTYINQNKEKTIGALIYKDSFSIFHVSFRIIRLVAESCNRVKGSSLSPSLYRDTRVHKMKFLTVFSNLPK